MSSTASHPSLDRFTIDVDQQVLDDLRTRLKATRFAPDPENDDEIYGLSTAVLRPLVEYWADGFDWRAVEARLNTLNQHRLDVGGTPVHFVHERGKGPAPIPLLLMHGWPWTYHHWHKVIGPLTDPAAHGGDPADAFDVVIPSLPGFGFSTPLTNPRENYASMADRFQTLMTEVLGYDRYGVGAADYGALVGARLGHKYADSLYGIHLGNEMPPAMFQGDRFWDLSGGQPAPGTPEPDRSRLIRRNNAYVSHVTAHLLDGQTLTHGLNDSPAGLLAWVLKRWRTWSDRNADFEAEWPADDILTFATIFWVNQAIGPDARPLAYEVSNGCALGGCLEEAALHGLVELAERDAFLLTWYARLPAPRVDLATVTDLRIAVLAERIRQDSGHRVLAFATTPEHGIPTAWVMAVHPTARLSPAPGDPRAEPAAVCAAGAHFDPEQALLNGLLELTANLGWNRDAYREERERIGAMVTDPDQVRDMRDHALLYCHPAAFDRFGFLLGDGPPGTGAPGLPVEEAFARADC
ncbi:alpha/beta fold hydrolase, partial [Streptomyces olivaceoviridis]